MTNITFQTKFKLKTANKQAVQ